MELFFSAFKSVTDRLSDAFKASLVPSLIGLAIFAFLFFGLGLRNLGSSLDGQITSPLLMILSIIVFFAMSLIIFVWVAITWHKVVIENQTPSLFPKFSGLPIGGYILRSILLGLMMLALLVPVMIFVSLFGLGTVNIGGATADLLSSSTSFLSILISILGVVIGTIVTFIWTRLASTLPSIAVGHLPRISEGWSQTKEHSREILIGSFFLNLFYVAIDLFDILVRMISDDVSIGLQLVLGWFTVMVGISFLTKTYQLTAPQANAAEIFE